MVLSYNLPQHLTHTHTHTHMNTIKDYYSD